MKEIWKDIPEYEGCYQVSNLGRIKSLKRKRSVGNNGFKILEEKILIPRKNNPKYYKIFLCRNNTKKEYYIHRLVMLSFVGHSNLQVNHIDGNGRNNNLDNLEYCTCSENHQHAFKIGLKNIKGEKHPCSKLKDIQVSEIRKKYKTGKYTQKQLGKIYNMSERSICGIVRYETWAHI